MSKKWKALVVGTTLLALLAAGVGAVWAAGAGGGQVAAKDVPAELQPLVDQVKAALEQLNEPAAALRDLARQIRENRRTIRDLVSSIGRDNLGDLEEEMRQLAQDARDDRAVMQEAKRIRHALKDSQRELRAALRAGDIDGARLILEQDLQTLGHSAQVLEQATQAARTRLDAQNALIEELRARAGG